MFGSTARHISQDFCSYGLDINFFNRYELDKEFNEVTVDGRDVTAVVTVKGDEMTIIQRATAKDEKDTKIVRKFVGDEVVETDRIEGTAVVATQRYKRL
jgi:hypothetical protein